MIGNKRRSQLEAQPGDAINWGHPLAQGLLYAFVTPPGGNQWADLTGRYALAFSQTVSRVASPGGFALSGGVVTIPAHADVNTMPRLSHAMRVRYAGGLTDQSILFIKLAGVHIVNGAPDTLYFRRNYTTGYNRVGFTPAINTWYSIVAAHHGGIAGSEYQLYVNGAVPTRVEDFNATGTLADDAASAIVLRASNTTGFRAWHDSEYIYLYNRPLLLLEAQWLHADPYAFVKPRAMRFPAIAAAGAPTTGDFFSPVTGF